MRHEKGKANMMNKGFTLHLLMKTSHIECAAQWPHLAETTSQHMYYHTVSIYSISDRFKFPLACL